jgi:hypothetical protein
MDFEAAPSQLNPLPVPGNYPLLQRMRRSPQLRQNVAKT